MKADRPPSNIPYARREPTKPPDWHGLVAWDMFLNALSTGLFLTAALAELVRPEGFRPVAAWAYPMAAAFLLADMGCLIFDLGNPGRFHHMLRVFKPLSPMSLGTWFLLAYSFPLCAVVGLDLLLAFGLVPASPVLWGIRMACVLLAIPLAFGTAAYKGVLFSTSAQPGWKEARWLGGYHLVSALTLGALMASTLAVFTGPEPALARLRPGAIGLLVLSLAFLGIVAWEMRTALGRRYDPGMRAALAGLVFGGGMIVPAAAVVLGGAWFLVLGTGLALLGALAARYAIVLLPHQEPSRAV